MLVFDSLTVLRSLWFDDAAFYSLPTGRTPVFLSADAGEFNDPHLSVEDLNVGNGTLPAWHSVNASSHLSADQTRAPALALPGDETSDGFQLGLPRESYDSPLPLFLDAMGTGRPNTIEGSPGHTSSVGERDPGLNIATARSMGSPTSSASTSVPKVQTPTAEREPFTTQGSLEVLPGAFSFYIGPTGVSDSLLLQREPYGAGGVAPASVKGLQYRCVAPPAWTATHDEAVNESVRDNGPILFGITDHALLDKAEPKPDSAASEHAWSALWQMIDAATAWSLLQLYTRFVDPYFPIVSPHQLPASPEELMSPSPSSSGKSRMSLALLTAMCAAALPFVVHDRSLYALLLRPPSSDHLYRLCWLGVTQELHAPTLSTLQACLLLQQRLPTNLYLHDTAFAWSLVATAVSVAQTMGLHRDPTGWTAVPAWERRLRRRLWWTLWTTETWVALTRGMPRLLGGADDEDTDVLPLGPADTMPGDTLSGNEGMSSDNDANNRSAGSQPYLLHLVGLTSILADIQRAYYTLRAARRTSQHLAHAMAVGRPLRARLQAWRDALPDGLRFRSLPSRITINSILADADNRQEECGADSSDGGSYTNRPSNVAQPPQRLDGNASLHLSYIVTHMMLFRALLRPLDDGDVRQGEGEGSGPIGTSNSNASGTKNSTDTCMDTPYADTDGGARNRAVTRGALLCVREFVEFVEALAPTHWNAFWHGWSRANFAMAGSFIVYLLHVVTVRTSAMPQDHEGSRSSQSGRGGRPAVCARPGFSAEYRELLTWIRRWRWASRVSVHGAAGAKGLTNLMLLRVETFLGELGGLDELKG